MTAIHYRTAKVDGRNVYYREAALKALRSCSCCTASPPSSHMFRDLIPLLADRIPHRCSRSAGIRQFGHA